MAFNYECDFYLQAQRLTPITKRQDVRLGMLESISEPIQWNRDNLFDSYLSGDASTVWDAGTNYVRYERVNYQNKIYECIDDNINQFPTLFPEYWVQVVGDFRGATERIKYNCQKIILEYILNKWFGTTFRQPEVGNSDFYITGVERTAGTFSVAEDGIVNGVYATSSVSQFSVGAEDYIGEASAYSASYNFIVHYPLSTIASTGDPEYFQMTALINKYKIFGSTVQYTPY